MGSKSYKSRPDFSPKLVASGSGGRVLRRLTGLEVLHGKSNLVSSGGL
jgi:hypothetical protein